MIRSLAAAAAALVLASGWAGAVRAQSFDDFMSLCEATGVDPAAVRQKAEALGWTPMPESALAAFRSDEPGAPFKATFAMLTPEDGVGMLIFATAKVPFGVNEDGSEGEVDADACMFATESLDTETAVKRLQGLGYGTLVEDEEEEAGGYLVYSRGPDGSVRDEGALVEATDADILAVARQRPLFLLGAIGDETVLLMVARVRAD